MTDKIDFKKTLDAHRAAVGEPRVVDPSCPGCAHEVRRRWARASRFLPSGRVARR